MGLLQMIGFGGAMSTPGSHELPDIFPFNCYLDDFVKTDIENLYARILTDVLERTQGVSEELKPLLWDNCVASESKDGLVTMLAKAMTAKSELFLIYDSATKVIKPANSQETDQIKKDYKDKGESKLGVYITFKNYKRTDMLKIYTALEYNAIAGLHKSMNLSKAVQLKMNDLRASVAVNDSSVAIGQAASIADALRKGKDVIIDAKDIIETAKPDMTATNSAMTFIDQKKSLYTGMPATYITGVSSKGLGDSGTGDAKAVERGFKNYYFSIVKPVIEAVFKAKTEFKSEDYEQLSQSLEALKTFEITSDELISQNNKRLVINRLFGFPENTKGDAPKKPEPVAGGAPQPAPAKV